MSALQALTTGSSAAVAGPAVAAGASLVNAPLGLVSRAAVMGGIVIAAGGTGGHFFPAEALAAELIRRGHRVTLMTDARSGGLRSTVFAGQDHFVIKGAGIAGRGLVRASRAVVALVGGVAQARGLLRRLRPLVVVGFGGYPCVPPVLGSVLMRRRPAVILHEQNAVLGRANRFLARKCDLLALSVPQTQRVPPGVTAEVTGNPVRPAIQALAQSSYVPPRGPIRLLILGGSLGARVFSDVVPAALLSLPEAILSRLTVSQQCRPEDLDRVRTAYHAVGITADLAPFFTDIADRLRDAHLVIARAGASTVAELAVAGRPAILVPLPGAIDDHQMANARALADAGGAWVMPQTGFTAAALAETMGALLSDPDTLSRAAAAALRQGRADAASRLADLVEIQMHQEVRR